MKAFVTILTVFAASWLAHASDIPVFRDGLLMSHVQLLAEPLAQFVGPAHEPLREWPRGY